MIYKINGNYCSRLAAIRSISLLLLIDLLHISKKMWTRIIKSISVTMSLCVKWVSRIVMTYQVHVGYTLLVMKLVGFKH